MTSLVGETASHDCLIPLLSKIVAFFGQHQLEGLEFFLLSISEDMPFSVWLLVSV